MKGQNVPLLIFLLEMVEYWQHSFVRKISFMKKGNGDWLMKIELILIIKS